MIQREREGGERLLAFANSHATFGDDAAAFIDSLVEQRPLGLYVIKRETKATVEENVAMLSEILEEGDEIAIASGDGGLANMLTALKNLGAKNPVATFDGGNKDDFPHELHDVKTLRDPEAVLSSKVASIRPLKVEVTTPDGLQSVRYGYPYWGAGITGKISADTCDPETRYMLRRMDNLHLGKLPRMTRENWIGLKALAQAIPMTIVEDETQKEYPAVEFNVLNGSRQGGINVIRKGNIFEDRAGILTIRDRTPRSLGRAARQIFQSDLRWFGPEETIGFTIYSPTSHFTEENGEAHEDPSGTHYSVSLDTDTVNVRASLAA